MIDPKANASGFGVQHTVESGAIFGPAYADAPASYNTTNAAIVPVIQGYWTSFIRSYNPNTYRVEGSPLWLNWDGSNPGSGYSGRNGTCSGDGYQRIMLQTNNTMMERVPQDQQERCAYLATIAEALTQ